MDEYYEAWQSPKNKRHAEYGGKSRDEIKARSSIAPVPIRPRRRCELHSLRTLSPGARFSPPITPRFQSQHTSTPAFQLRH